MLQASELRIGNWVNDDGYYQQIHFTDIADLSTGCGGAHLYKPIVLTPEILEKAGFVRGEIEKTECYSLKLNDPFGRDQRLTAFVPYELGCALFYNKGMVGTSVLYLHSLQNLYFALTGTELNINL